MGELNTEASEFAQANASDRDLLRRNTKPVRANQYPEYEASYGAGIPLSLPMMKLIATMVDRMHPKRDQTFTEVSGRTPNRPLTAATRDLLSAVAALDPDPKTRIYKKAVLERSKAPITEKDFKPKELESLAQAILEARAKGRDVVKHEDYIDPTFQKGYEAVKEYKAKHGKLPEMISPFHAIIGQAKFSEKGGKARITDSYDFNRYNNWQAGIGNPLEWLGNPAIWYGRRAVPSGLRGTPVDVQVPIRKK